MARIFLIAYLFLINSLLSGCAVLLSDENQYLETTANLLELVVRVTP